MNMRRITGYLASLLALSSFCALGQTEYIVNGGFEQGLTGWTIPNGDGIGVVAQVNSSLANSGSGYLKMGEVGMTTDAIYQTVTLPTNIILAQLSYWRNLYCPVGNDGTFTAFIQYTNPIGTTLTTNIEIIGMNQIGAGKGNGFYSQNLADLSAFAGLTIQIAFELDTGTFGAAAYAAIDDVSLQVATTANIPANDNFTNRIAISGNTATVFANNVFATKEPGEPNHAGNAGGKSVWWKWTSPGEGIVQINTQNSQLTPLLAAYTGTNITNLVSVASDNGANEVDFARVKFIAHTGVEYEIAVDGYNVGGVVSAGNIQLNFTFTPDTTPAKVTISSPVANAKLTNGTVTVTGTASDNVAVAVVLYRLENAAGTNDYQVANGTNHWTATITNLIPGLNTVRVFALDTVSNPPATTAARTFDFVIVSPFTLGVSGSGTVSPNQNDLLLEVGKSYTITAKPAANNLFSNWVGDVSSSSSKLTFMMQTNMTIQANFITNVFIAVKGNYAGLFYGTNNTTLTNAGYFSASVTPQGAMSAKIMLPIGTVSVSCKLGLDGTFSNTVARSVAGPVQIIGQVDLNGGDVITGQLTLASQTLDLLANRAVFSRTAPPPQAGQKYTIAIPGGDSTNAPGGFGTAAITIDLSGNISLNGALGDGTRITQKAFIAKNGQWPFFAAPYSKHGLIFGWLTFDMNNASNGPTGNLTWMKSAVATSKFYPLGFDFEDSLETASSLYVLPTGAPIFTWTSGIAVLQGAGLSQSVTNPFTIGANNKVTGSNGMKLTFTPASGTFTGSVVDPDTGKPLTISGIALQSDDAGFGKFTTTNQTGSVLLLPTPF